MVTMTDVAKAAGVSRATASYALSGDPRITAKTAKKVLEAAETLHYTANLSAKTLRSGHNGVIGVAIFELDKPYPSEMSAEISREAARHNVQAIIQQTSGSKESEVSILRKVTSQLCDGTIFSPGKVSSGEVKALAHGKPIVMLDDISDSPIFDTVYTPCEESAHIAIDHLLASGCKHILMLGSAYPTGKTHSKSVSARRTAGCIKAFADAGLAVGQTNFLHCDWDTDSARKAVCEMPASRRKKIDGIFCMTDSIAIGAIRGLADCGVQVPDDVLVVGIDGISESGSYIPSITTVATDTKDLAHKSVNMLLERIEHPEEHTAPRLLTAKCKLIVRESTLKG
jgi:DNA-binding LacI/PurR family transcriptional regulator